MNEPAESSTEHRDPSSLPLEEKVEIMRQQLEWICFQVQGLLTVAQSNPMVRMAMNSAQKKASRG